MDVLRLATSTVFTDRVFNNSAGVVVVRNVPRTIVRRAVGRLTVTGLYANTTVDRGV